jgi:hypothetical protein
MPAVLTLVADAVAELLTEASHEFGVEFVAQRGYPPKDEPLTALNTLRVDVVPVNHDESTILDRSRATSYLCSVDIGIRKKFGRSERDSDTGQVEQAEMDRLVELVEQIHDHLTDPEGKRRLPRGVNGLDATWENTRIRAAYMPRHYREWQQFTGLVRVSYRARKS